MKSINLQQNFLEKSLSKMISSLKKQDFDGEPKVSVYDIKTGASVSINGDSPGWAASIIKFPIMIAAMNEVSKGNLKLEEKIAVNHKFTLEPYDLLSNIPNGELVPLPELICEMIVNSDNEATNMIANRIGVHTINNFMWDIGMNTSMLGHLLCPKVPRYTSKFNKDGSNITTPNDMMKSIREVYDRKYSKLDINTRKLSDYFFTFTERGNIKYKIGVISDVDDGDDVHEVGIMDNRLIYAIMINKIGQKEINAFNKHGKYFGGCIGVNFTKPLYFNENNTLDDEVIPNTNSVNILANANNDDTTDALENQDIDAIAFPVHDLASLKDDSRHTKLKRPYSFDKENQSNVYRFSGKRDMLSEIIYPKRSYRRYYDGNLAPGPKEVHYMIKNILHNYLYLE